MLKSKTYSQTPRTIGVFDSGVGGRSVARAIERDFPTDTVIFVNDSQHVPYGDKTPEQVLSFVVPILEDLVQQGCQTIIIACNSVTTMLIAQLRAVIPVPLIGMEPMVRPAAALTQTKTIAVCATPMTLASKRYQWLKESYATGITVLEPECNTWAYMIEHNEVNEALIRSQIEHVCWAGADVIVLGCTHYHWIEDTIQEIAAHKATVIQPEQAVIARLHHVLQEMTE